MTETNMKIANLIFQVSFASSACTAETVEGLSGQRMPELPIFYGVVMALYLCVVIAVSVRMEIRERKSNRPATKP